VRTAATTVPGQSTGGPRMGRSEGGSTGTALRSRRRLTCEDVQSVCSSFPACDMAEGTTKTTQNGQEAPGHHPSPRRGLTTWRFTPPVGQTSPATL